MDPRKAKVERTDVRTNKVEATTLYRHKDYNFYYFRWKEKTLSELLEVAALKPKRKSLPEFMFRWDEEIGIVKVYIREVPKIKRLPKRERQYLKERIKNFEGEKNGYAGHHTITVPDCKGRRIFEAKIKIPPGIKVFHGCITVPLCRSVKATVSISTRTMGKLQVLKKPEQ